jgi:TetR/AcrR family transcriptional regulator
MPKPTFFNLPPEKREQLLQLALDEFAQNDYQAASISRIVAAGGIAKGSFYQYFANKEDLYHYLLSLGTEQKAEFMATHPPPPQMDIFAYLRWLAQSGLAFELAHPQLSQIAYRALRDQGLPPAIMQQAQKGVRAFFADLVQQGQTHGHINPELDADLVGFWLQTVFSELGGYLLNRLPEDAEVEVPFAHPLVQTLFNQMVQMLEMGLRPPSRELMEKDEG